MKSYPSQPFSEVYIIQLPAAVLNDPELLWIERIAYWFFVHYKGDTAKVLNELGIKERYFRIIKNHLASRGHIYRVEERGQIKYLPLDLDSAYWLKIQHLRAASKVGFKQIPDANIYALKEKHSLAHMLHVMEVLEWTYRNGKETIKKPHHLLARSCNTGVTPAEGFISGFWQNDLEEKPAEKRISLKNTATRNSKPPIMKRDLRQ